MDKLEIRTADERRCFYINGIPLTDCLKAALREKGMDDSSVEGLEVTWGAAFDHEGDARFMRYLMQQDKAGLPLLSCPDDMDFSCVVIIAQTEKTEHCVYWKRIGRITHAAESFDAEKEHGIAFVDNYTDEDWQRYDDPGLYEVGSDKWKKWVSENWEEELFRRRKNFTAKCYMDDRNIEWLTDCGWCFDRKKYEELAAAYQPVLG